MFTLLIICNVLMVATFFLRLPTLPPQLPLFYTKIWGEEQLVDSWVIFLMPLIVSLLYFLNNYFYRKYFPTNDLVKKILEILNIFLIISFTLVFLKIIFLVS